MIDVERLKAWLAERSQHHTPIVGAVYAGLLSRIERGQFDEEEEADK